MTTLCDNVCQCLAAGRRFSPGTAVSLTNKTDHHDITEIPLEVALNTIRVWQPSLKVKWSLTMNKDNWNIPHLIISNIHPHFVFVCFGMIIFACSYLFSFVLISVCVLVRFFNLIFVCLLYFVFCLCCFVVFFSWSFLLLCFVIAFTLFVLLNQSKAHTHIMIYIILVRD